jgi:transcriptional regulator with XRE-family HTH domain
VPVEDDVAPLRHALADLLAGLRESAGLTQQVLADQLGYARVTVSCAETGHRLPAEGFWSRADEVLLARGELTRAYEQLAVARRERRQRLTREADVQRRARASRQRAVDGPAPAAGQASPRPVGTTPTWAVTGGRAAVASWPGVTASMSVEPAAVRRPVEDDGARADRWTMTVSRGRFFSGSTLDVLACEAVEEEGRLLATVPTGLGDDPILRRPTRGMLVLVVPEPTGPTSYGVDTRAARRRLAWAGDGARLAIPRGYALDELTLGLIWAVANLDESLLGDDALLAGHRERLIRYEPFPRSAAGRDDADGLSAVSQMWLGSDFCARHILRYAERLADAPAFWTREQRGEEASTWLLFAHKYEYLRRLAGRFGSNTGLSRAFCIPADTVAASPRFERVVLLLAAALMESFGVRIEVCGDPEYAGVEGFVLDHSRQAIIANWVGADGIWHVDITDRRPALREYAEVYGHARSHSATAAPTPAGRLRAFADYLDLNWAWLTRRCGELGEYGLAGIAEPRSRLMSTAGVDQACRYLGGLDQPVHS